MATWVSCHGAGAIITDRALFTISAGQGGALIRPMGETQVKGSVIFPIPSLPQGASTLAEIAVYFTSNAASVVLVSIMAGNHILWNREVRRTSDFRIDLRDDNIKVDQEGKGIAILVAFECYNTNSQLNVESVGLNVAVPSQELNVPVPSQGLKFESGTWSTTDVRPWTQSQLKTDGPIKFSTKFSSVPTVTVSMTGADVSEGIFRVKVYATDVDEHGFLVHADTWSDTKLYSCGVSWIAIGL
ncbi:hypothetical protein F4859DRAFT_486688 [Xylaria cf. heliscus]|nr:hypothetical protein F4859DRAFT_486688 [Xylaria cf. heliscus]